MTHWPKQEQKERREWLGGVVLDRWASDKPKWGRESEGEERLGFGLLFARWLGKRMGSGRRG